MNKPKTIDRAWAMPSRDTFSIPPIWAMVKRYLQASKVSVDPFARNNRLATYTNDINPATLATSHVDAREFLKKLSSEGVTVDLALIDPPYSPRQISECYSEIGKKCTTTDTQNARLYSEVRDLIMPLLPLGGVVLSFGLNSAGMGIKRGFAIEEILLVCHGGAHNDTICMAERRIESMEGAQQNLRWNF